MSNDIVLGIKLVADGSNFVGEAKNVQNALKGMGEQASEASKHTDGLASALAKVGHYTTAYFGISQVVQYTQSVVAAQVALDSFNAKMAVSTMESVQRVGLDYAAVEVVMRLRAVKPKQRAERFDEIRAMESAALAVLSEALNET